MSNTLEESILFAALSEDWPEANRLIHSMNRVELRAFLRALSELDEIASGRLDYLENEKH